MHSPRPPLAMRDAAPDLSRRAWLAGAATVGATAWAGRVATARRSGRDGAAGGGGTVRKVALLTGVNDYDQNGFAKLDWAERDMTEFAAALRGHGYAVRTLLGGGRGADRATKANFEAALAELLTSVSDTDTVLLAFAGHGEQIAGTRETYFAPVDAAPGDPAGQVGLTGLTKRVDRGGGINLILADACRDNPNGPRAGTAGGGLNGNALLVPLPTNTALLFACSAGQQALESPAAGGGHGVFFHHVVLGLKGAAADPGTGRISWDSLVAYLRESVNGTAKRAFPGRAKTADLLFGGRLQNPHAMSNLVATPELAGRTVIVDAAGGGDFATIAAALEAVPAGSVIRVRPGVYRGGLVIDRSVTIEAAAEKAGGGGDVVLESDAAHGLHLTAPAAVIRGLTIRCTAVRAARQGEAFSLCGVLISSGRPLLEDCAVTSTHGSCLLVENANTAPTVRRVAAIDGARMGLGIQKGAGGRYEDCRFLRNGRSGVFVEGAGSAPEIVDCLVEDWGSRDPDRPGLYVASGAGGSYRNCTVRGGRGGGAGIAVMGAGTNPDITDCVAERNSGVGVQIENGAGGRFTRCTIRDSATSGVFASGAGTAPLFTDCTVSGADESGLFVADAAAGSYRDCRFVKNGHNGALVEKAGRGLSLRRCEFNHNDAYGLDVDGASELKLIDCEMRGNRSGAEYFVNPANVLRLSDEP